MDKRTPLLLQVLFMLFTVLGIPFWLACYVLGLICAVVCECFFGGYKAYNRWNKEVQESIET